jgi:dTDP-4-amino-4,6-dideoxygalactose transaminase
MTTIDAPLAIKVPFVDFKRRYSLHRKEILEAVDTVFSSGSYILGGFVEAFEQAIAEYLDCPYVLGVANGTDAIILGLKAFDIGVGDEVIIPVNSFIASAGAVAAVGATPVFCDVNDDLNINTDQISSLITSKTKAIMPVHLTGRPADMQAIMVLAKQHNLIVIEDAAQSIGASFQGQKTGTIGDMGTFSLHPLKNLFAYGDAGIITTRNKELYNKLKLMRNHGLADRDTCVSWGLNSRLDSVQAKLALIGLKYLDEWTARRRKTAKLYQDSLSTLLKVPFDNEHSFSVYHNFVALTEQRDALMRSLKGKEIETKIHYPIPMHLQPAAASLGYKKGDFPVAEKLTNEMVSLPICSELNDEQIRYVIRQIEIFFEER